MDRKGDHQLRHSQKHVWSWVRKLCSGNLTSRRRSLECYGWHWCICSWTSRRYFIRNLGLAYIQHFHCVWKHLPCSKGWREKPIYWNLLHRIPHVRWCSCCLIGYHDMVNLQHYDAKQKEAYSSKCWRIWKTNLKRNNFQIQAHQDLILCVFKFIC